MRIQIWKRIILLIFVKILEDLLKKCQEINEYWKEYSFSQEQKIQIKSFYKKKLRNFADFALLSSLYKKEIKNLEEDIKANKWVSKKQTSTKKYFCWYCKGPYPCRKCSQRTEKNMSISEALKEKS